MKNFERIKNMDSEELSMVVGCPDDFDEAFEVPDGCVVYKGETGTPVSCIKCIREYLEREVEE